MDFDHRFDKAELEKHLRDVGVPAVDMDELLTRTTNNTRRGTEFSFKPYEMLVGTSVAGSFRYGFRSTLNRKGICIDSTETQTAVWFRFDKELIMFRCFCRLGDSTVVGMCPYEGHWQFGDISPGGIMLNASHIPGSSSPDHEVEAEFCVTARRPPIFSPRLPHCVVVLREPYFDRIGTEADFMEPEVVEQSAGPVRAIGDDRLVVDLALWMTHVFRFKLTRRAYKPLDQDWRRILRNTNAETFATRYLVEGLLSHGLISICEVESLRGGIRIYEETQRVAILEGIFKAGRHSDVRRDVRGELSVARRITPQHTPPHCYRIRRCLVTPTRCLLNPPVNETSNDLLRMFSEHIDQFLRVQFVDDRGDLPVTAETIEDGIIVAQRHYVFLCFGESQGKTRGFWAICEYGDFTVANVLARMGDLSKETVVAKHATRQGLLLSTTRAIELPCKWSLTEMAEVERNGHIFTDGVATCGPNIADLAAKALGYKQLVPSAIQVRIGGGTKGVLSVSVADGIDANHIGRRGSQIKFPSTHQTLSVVKIATYSKATLNRQAIILMECLGVPTKVLVDIFRDEKTAIEGSNADFKDRLAQVAAFPLVKVLDSGFGSDPFIQDLVTVIRCRMLSDLKWKQWIEIPDSAFLMGIADETDSLEEGQIFCQIEPPSKNAQVILGSCTTYRNPCLHPGDMRLAEAVDCARLRHLKNVVVFSTRGSRPLHNMLSGGDLDGDFYTVIWDRRLLLNRDLLHEPMDYTPVTPFRAVPPITVDHTKQHFLNFMFYDVLGQVSNAHMAHADQSGPRSEKCLRIAALASQAVDLPKSGVPVNVAEIPVVEEYPDFMGKEPKSIRLWKKVAPKTYQSERALGQMFRQIGSEPVFEQMERPFWLDPRLQALHIPNKYCGYWSTAARYKAQYEFELVGILRRFSISEAECVVGLLLRSPDTRLRVEKDHDLRIALRETYGELVSAVRERVREYITQNTVSDQETDQRMWALVAYRLTYDPQYHHEVDWSDIDKKLRVEATEEDALVNAPEMTACWSFPWLFDRDLCAQVTTK
ncbi:hypothetical protein EUX98_g1143 [Antrodiella citrinella]|uniref:RNA-dependent RNA polymerase n=1 Tax=Antrodiella citrinella TaxID=2447956 RepID=A0A4S4N281_9APHY|nr:hypothetical protein EUX98_g1143 [Antrodiella citrinella]